MSEAKVIFLIQLTLAHFRLFVARLITWKDMIFFHYFRSLRSKCICEIAKAFCKKYTFIRLRL